MTQREYKSTRAVHDTHNTVVELEKKGRKKECLSVRSCVCVCVCVALKTTLLTLLRENAVLHHQHRHVISSHDRGKGLSVSLFGKHIQF